MIFSRCHRGSPSRQEIAEEMEESWKREEETERARDGVKKSG